MALVVCPFNWFFIIVFAILEIVPKGAVEAPHPWVLGFTGPRPELNAIPILISVP